ncbi:LysR family transcriptional regulator [Rhizobiales bacterium RZME27]|uniref:LysR family transcriptional regulator n=1 Tax=Endobacterium cereale TaxID=2663029 RepID=A0A6A8A7E1_9HYPH|nr:LysR family transcriptional regulator [Endobacterium cereale]MEB2847975.1 LysR family transcriptional regulator [Endobacterium cereale]MQY46689.1 LysR family transcriptional regulator [Endobacterium cereale]
MDVVAALRTFLRVAETGSFSSAALDLGLTQPAVSRQISSLEAHYSTRLLHRSTNGLSLTVEGEQMIPMARKVIDAMEALGDTTAAESVTTSGRVRMSLPAPLGLHISERLPALLKRHPRLTIETVFREEPSDLVGEGIDIEVRLGDVSDSSLICRRLGWTTAFLVASPGYVCERGMPSGPDEIAQHDCICYGRGGETRAWMFVDGADQVRAAIAPRMVFNNATAVYRATIAGGGLAILSHILVAEDIASGRLINVLPYLPPARLPITAVYASRRNLPLRVRMVLDFLADAVKEDPLMTGAAS